ncbi:227 kDa spindle and centromere-associated protein-like protein [Gossypium australe]|uniref:227 kDa spindle and centromere-associated protein-like protein n=1 Tax=Gossypium australe TaxID=47621 RepID=A0A5B6WX63_9ROSI|nr:227 kDa spindle and centromere-associated protein-like protein [Gossypium australe]
MATTLRRDDITEENWIMILQKLQEDDVAWRAPWAIPDEIIYRCGDFDYVPMLGIWGAVGYAPLLVLRQYRSRQFTPPTQGLTQCEFDYKGENYKKRVREISNAWGRIHRMKRFAANPMTTPEYDWWGSQKINDNIPTPDQEDIRSLEEHLQVVPSELEIIKQDFERKNRELGKRIEQLEEEKMQLGLDVDIQKLEAEKLRKGKNKAEEDLDSLKTDYKKLRRSMKTAGLGKTSEQWRQEIKEEKHKASQWERKLRETQEREDALKRSLVESQNEKESLKARVSELEKSLYQYRSRNSVVELRASLSKIEEMKARIEELESALHGWELRAELFEANEDRWKQQLHHYQNQVRDRDYIMGEAVAQVREVADHLQALAVQADVLSLMYESKSERGQELAGLLEKVKALSIRARPYIAPNYDRATLEHRYGTRGKTRAMDQRMERLEQMQKEMQDQLQERLTKIQQEMIEQMQESQTNMISQLAQLLANERGKGAAASSGNNDDPAYPPGFTPPNTQAPPDACPQRTPFIIRPQCQVETAIPGPFPTGSGTNPREGMANPIVPDFDEMAEMDKAKADLPRQLEDRCKWLEEKFKEIETADHRYGVDAKDLSLVPDLVLPPKFKIPDFEKYNGTSCPEAHITIFCRRMAGYVNNDQLLIHCFQDSLAGAAAKWYNQLSRTQIKSWKDLAQAFLKQYGHVADIAPDRITHQNMEKKPNESFRQYAQR